MAIKLELHVVVDEPCIYLTIKQNMPEKVSLPYYLACITKKKRLPEPIESLLDKIFV